MHVLLGMSLKQKKVGKCWWLIKRSEGQGKVGEDKSKDSRVQDVLMEVEELNGARNNWENEVRKVTAL